MAESLKTSLIQFRRFYPHCIEKLDGVTRDDFVAKNNKYLYFVSYTDKLKELYQTIITLVNEYPGILTQDQIDSLHSAMKDYDEKLEMLKQRPIIIQKRKPVAKEESSDSEVDDTKQVGNTEPETKPTRDFEELSLSEMRELLGLNAHIEEERNDTERERIMEEILNTTNQIREETETIHQRVVESNKSLDMTQDLQENNLNAVRKETKQIKKITSSFFGTLFQDLKTLLVVSFIVFICIVVIFILPKPK